MTEHQDLGHTSVLCQTAIRNACDHSSDLRKADTHNLNVQLFFFISYMKKNALKTTIKDVICS